MGGSGSHSGVVTDVCTLLCVNETHTSQFVLPWQGRSKPILVGPAKIFLVESNYT